ncbi:MAG: peptidoglycan DD-metalloendopeptidase family protein [Cyanobacteria bacterium J06639_1]
MTNGFQSRRDRGDGSRVDRPRAARTRFNSLPSFYGRALGVLALSVNGWLALTALPQAIAMSSDAVQGQTAIARLQAYTFNPALNRLEIRTSADVRPRAAVVEESGDVRVIVDVPNASWNAATREQTYTGAIRSLRLAQLNSTTVRFVLDVAPGKALSDRDLSLERTGETTWAISLDPALNPTARRNLPPRLDPRALLSPPSPPQRPTAPQQPDVETGFTRVLEIQDTAEGFFIRTDRRPQVSTRLLSSPTRLAIDLVDTDVAGLYGAKQQPINRHGVYALRFSQWQPNIARIVLDVAPFNTRWTVDYDADRGGLRVYPQGRAAFQSPGTGRSLARRPDPALCEPTGSDNAIASALLEDPTALAYPLAAPAPMSSGFGYRIHPVTGASSFHQGVDLAAPTGTPILAALSGEVAFAGARGNLGNAVILDHAQSYRTRYGHMSRVMVRAGDRVRRGQLIGYVGSTGRSTGPHLHFEYLQQNPDGIWIALDPQAQVLAATPSGATPLVSRGAGAAIGGNEVCDRP